MHNQGKYRYQDIKMNVVIEANNKAIVAEVQFLTKFILQAKILGNSLYGISRRCEYVDNVNMLYSFKHGTQAQELQLKCVFF